MFRSISVCFLNLGKFRRSRHVSPRSACFVALGVSSRGVFRHTACLVKALRLVTARVSALLRARDRPACIGEATCMDRNGDLADACASGARSNSRRSRFVNSLGWHRLNLATEGARNLSKLGHACATSMISRSEGLQIHHSRLTKMRNETALRRRFQKPSEHLVAKFPSRGQVGTMPSYPQSGICFRQGCKLAQIASELRHEGPAPVSNSD